MLVYYFEVSPTEKDSNLEELILSKKNFAIVWQHGQICKLELRSSCHLLKTSIYPFTVKKTIFERKWKYRNWGCHSIWNGSWNLLSHFLWIDCLRFASEYSRSGKAYVTKKYLTLSLLIVIIMWPPMHAYRCFYSWDN